MKNDFEVILSILMDILYVKNSNLSNKLLDNMAREILFLPQKLNEFVEYVNGEVRFNSFSEALKFVADAFFEWYLLYDGYRIPLHFVIPNGAGFTIRSAGETYAHLAYLDGSSEGVVDFCVHVDSSVGRDEIVYESTSDSAQSFWNEYLMTVNVFDSLQDKHWSVPLRYAVKSNKAIAEKAPTIPLTVKTPKYGTISVIVPRDFSNSPSDTGETIRELIMCLRPDIPYTDIQISRKHDRQKVEIVYAARDENDVLIVGGHHVKSKGVKK